MIHALHEIAVWLLQSLIASLAIGATIGAAIAMRIIADWYVNRRSPLPRAIVTRGAHGGRIPILDECKRSAHAVHMMTAGNTITISGAIDRADPDPAAPSNPWRQHIGMVGVAWHDLDGHEVRSMAAMIRDASGCGATPLWRGSQLVLVWIGDPPPALVVQAVHDWVWDRGPAHGVLEAHLAAQWRSETTASYAAAR